MDRGHKQEALVFRKSRFI